MFATVRRSRRIFPIRSGSQLRPTGALTMQYFEQQRLRWSRKGLDVAWRSRDLLRDGAFYRRWCPLVLGLSAHDLDEFHYRLEFVIDRLESIGFMCRLIETELTEQRQAMEEAYRPGSGAFPDHVGEHFSGSEDAPTVRYSFEGFLLLACSFLEYLSRAIGFLVKHKNERHVDRLLNALSASDDVAVKRLKTVFNDYRRVWQELQSEGVRDVFANVRVASPTTDAKALRDVVAHFRTARLNSFQMLVRRDAMVPSDMLLEPGAWAHEYPGAPAFFGEGKGIARVCRRLTQHLAELTEKLLAVLRDQNATPPGNE